MMGRMVMAVVCMTLGVAQVAPAFIAGDGKGKADRDCYIGLDGYSPADLSPINEKGTKQGIACTDCDPSCDLDGVAEPNGSCTFRVGACINVTGIAGCDPSTRDPKKVKAQAKSREGTFEIGATFPGDLSSACSALIDFPVALKGKQQNKPGKGTVTLLAKKKTDKDKFIFLCNPRPQGEACPAPTTTTTNTVPTTVTTSSTAISTSSTTVTTTTTSTTTTSGTSSSTSSTTVTSTSTTLPPSTTTSTTVPPGTTTSTSLPPTTTITTTTTSTTTSTTPTTTSTSTSTTTTTMGSPMGSFVR